MPLAVQAELTAPLADDARRAARACATAAAWAPAPALRLSTAPAARSRRSSRCCARATSSAPSAIDVAVEPAIATSAHGCAPPPTRNRELADRSDRISWIGTVVVMVLLRRRADRAARRCSTAPAAAACATTTCAASRSRTRSTGLPNRALFEQRIAETLAAGEPAVVAFLDLDDFKQVNDSLGHAAGDRLLEICGERLRNALRAERHRRPPGRRRVRDPRASASTDLDALRRRACSTCSPPR